MALAAQDIEQIEAIVHRVLAEQDNGRGANVRYDLELRERFVRVEEELKHQRELMREGFKQMEKRFEQVDKRFEQVDKRFEQVDKRFEQQHREIMALHQEIKILMRWGIGALIGLGGLMIGLFRLVG